MPAHRRAGPARGTGSAGRHGVGDAFWRPTSCRRSPPARPGPSSRCCGGSRETLTNKTTVIVGPCACVRTRHCDFSSLFFLTVAEARSPPPRSIRRFRPATVRYTASSAPSEPTVSSHHPSALHGTPAGGSGSRALVAPPCRAHAGMPPYSTAHVQYSATPIRPRGSEPEPPPCQCQAPLRFLLLDRRR